VAGVATAVVAVLYVVVAVAVLLVAVRAMNDDANQKLQDQLFHSRGPALAVPSDMVAWLVNADGTVADHTQNAPPLPIRPESSGYQTVTTGDGATYRLLVAPGSLMGPNSNVQVWVVLGMDIGYIYRGTAVLGIVELLFGIAAVSVIFLGAYAVGQRAVAPVERARQRQLAFTADASHELRTPLQVIEAETSLALLRDRSAEAYKHTIKQVAQEGRRLHAIVDDLLWLARFESEPTTPQSKLVDVREVVATALERFEAVASQKGISLTVGHASEAAPLVMAPPEWLERLAGVLVDNACRYTPDGGRIRLSTTTNGGRAWLSVEDSGPGIPEDQVARIFDRFHRASSKPGGAGLGLSIADSVVRATGGHWRVTRSPDLGGAWFEVSWPLARPQKGQAVQSGESKPAPSALNP
jgi:two-component system, OmpR family, sensor histidine kinase CiaH